MSTDDYTLQLDTNQYQQSMAQANAITQQFTGSVSSLTAGSKTLSIGLLALVPGIGILTKGFGGFAAQAASMEQNLSGLRATAAVSGQNIDRLTSSAMSLARAFPIGNAGAIQVIGQLQNLGITGANSEQKISSLAKTMINLAGATGSSTGAITQSMVQVSRAFGDQNLDPKRITRFGDSLTTLQAKFGGSAEGILSFTKQIAPFARQAGIGESATMGIAAAFSKLGDDGGSAGTAINKILGDINKSVRDGTPQIYAYASIVGKTADQFRTLAKVNPAEALTQVVEALGNGVQGQRGLEQLGFGDSVRTAKALNELSQGGQLRSAIATSIGGYDSGSTATGAKEAFTGLNDSLTKLSAASEQAAAAFGAPFLKPLTGLADVMVQITSGLAGFAASGTLQELAKIIAEIGLAFAAYKIAGAFGSAGVAQRLATNNLPMTLSRAGRLVGEAGGDEANAYRMAQTRASKTGIFGRTTANSRRGMRDLRALDARRAYQNMDEEDRSGYQKGAYGYGQYRQKVTETGVQNVQDRIAAVYAQYGEGPEFYEAQQSILKDANRNPINRGLRRSVGPVSRGIRTVSEGIGRYRTQMYRMADAQENDPLGTFRDSGPQGTLKQPLQDLKDAAAGKGPLGGASRGISGLAGRIKDLGSVTTEAGKALRDAHAAETKRTAVLRTAEGLTAGPRARLFSADSAAFRGIRAAGSGLLSAVGGGPGLAVMGGLAAAQQVYSSYQSSQQQFRDQQDHLQNMSITGTIDHYRDTVGKATDTTQTIAQSVITVSKAMDAAVTDMSRARQLTSGDMAQASSMKSGIVHRFVGTDAQIASQVSGLQVGGLGPQELQAAKLDLYRQYGQVRTNSILGMVDTSGSALASGPNGSGGASSLFTGDTADAIVHSYNTSKTGRSLMQWVGQGQWDKHGHVGKTTQGLIDTGVQGLTDQATAQEGNFGAGYARQEQMKNADQLIRQLRASGASDDVIKYTTNALSQQLGAGAKEFDNGDLNSTGGSFTALLAKRGGKDYQQQLKNFQSQYKGFGNLTASQTMGTTGQAVAGIKGYGSLFDNTKGGGFTNLINSVTSGSQVGDATTLAQAAQAIIDSSSKLGNNLSDTADKAAKAAAALGDTGTAADLNNMVRVKALQTQSYQDQFGGGQAAIAHQLLNAQKDANNTDRSPSGQARRDASPAEAAAALQNLKDLYSQQIQMNMQFNITMQRGKADYIQQTGYQQTDFNTQTIANEHDRLISVYRANLNYQQQTAKSDHDFYLGRERQQQLFALNMARGAEDAAKSMYDPYHRIQTEAIWDGNSMIENLGEQAKAAEQQMADLAAARKKGLSSAAIEALSLADASHGQELHALVQDASQNTGLIGRLNSAVATKASAVTGLYNDPGNVTVKRAKEDNARIQAQSLADYKFNMAFSLSLFKQTGAESTADFIRQTTRTQVQFNLSMSREATAYAINIQRMNEDLVNSQKSVDGSLAQLQAIAHKGLSASADDFKTVMHNTMSAVEAMIAATGVDVQGLTNRLTNGTLGVLPGGQYVPPSYVQVQANSSDPNFFNQFGAGFTGAQGVQGATVSGHGGDTQGTLNGLLGVPHAMGGIMMRPHLGMVGEAGPEAVIPLNQRGISVLAGALTEAYQSLNTQGARSHIHYDSSSHHYDHSIDVSGPITVMSEDPNEMGRKLAAKARSRNLTATQTRKYG